MITDISDLAGHDDPVAQVVVVGTGIAGVTVALHLARRGAEVILLESGREAFDPAIQALNELDFAGKPHRTVDPDAPYHRYLDPALRGISRLRRFGGTSMAWTGKWKYLQRSDFEPRPWVPDSDWPIDLDELLPHYRAAARECGFGDLEAAEHRPAVAALRRTVADHGLKLSSFYWEAEPMRTATRFGDEMRRMPNLHVILGATATELLCSPDGRRVEGVRCADLDGHRITVRGDQVVLAAGALETARLMLASDAVTEGGVGNANGLVGRFYTDHPKHHFGTLWPGPVLAANAALFQYAPKPRFCLCLSLDDRTQRAEGLLEHVIYLKPIYENRLEAARRLLRGGRAVRDGNGRAPFYRIKFVTEQAPHRDSRVRLGAEVDALGVRRAVLDWRFTDLDARSMARVVALSEDRIEACGLGRVDWGDDPPRLDGMTDAAHQMGTTRMAARPEDGVVDPHCRVWGTANLHVAGSAVFPTGPSYSPTFTILALARRLGDRLASGMGLPERSGDAIPEPMPRTG
ncbi:GMC family oxidoreductase [Jannaschia sp. LMIT008]|uniref:GMC family oxidoreductase n=1 Tax=Jannaschia maritima TaxID=3032585 RepID=UPI00281285CE|nr:GMC family oxidoreductase [Jannaschia sp. LMIT008]